MDINIIIESLFDVGEIPKGAFRARSQENKIRSPQLAFKAVYGYYPSTMYRGRTFSEKRMWNGIEVDGPLKDEWLDSLNKIRGIEIRSSCAGHDANRVAFIVFRPYRQDENYVKQVVKKLKKCPRTFSIYDIGNRGKFRIVVATDNWHRMSGSNLNWEKWWEQISHCIEKAV